MKNEWTAYMHGENPFWYKKIKGTFEDNEQGIR